MDKIRQKNRLIFPYLILIMALVCAVLILSDLYSSVDEIVVFPYEGPTPTPTLWWRTPQTATPTSPAAVQPGMTLPDAFVGDAGSVFFDG